MHRFVILAIILGLPAAMRAEFSETVILPVDGSLNFDTGQVGTSGGDIVWNGHTIAPQGTVVLRNREHAPGFDTWGQMFVDLQLRGASADPIAENFVVPGDVFLAKSNGGHDAKVRIEANNRSSLVLHFTTFAPPPGGPLVTQVLNNSSYLPFGYPGYGIAPSSLFVVRGTNLADPGDPVLHSSEAPGIPLTLNGASLTVVVNGVTTHPALYYTSPTQLAAVLPAATPVGSGTLTVTYNGQTSPPTPMVVVPSALGINTYYGNIGVATDATTGALLTYTNSGVAGQTIVLWSTGLGANPADSDTTLTLTPHAVNTPLQIYIGGLPATVLYAGASPYPGVNQINLTIPQGVPTGCWVPLVAITNGTSIGNVVTLPITSGGGVCKDVITQFTGDQLAITPGQTVRGGLVALLHVDTPDGNGKRTIQNVADGAFQRYSGIYVPDAQVSPGGCIVGPLIAKPIPQIRGLDPGPVRLTGPSGLDITLPLALGVKGTLYSPLGDSVLTSGGTFTFQGSGGADVGSFNVSLDIHNPLLTWTNSADAANIDKSKGLLVKWTGGNPGSFVIISGSVADAVGTFVRYQCEVSADAGQFLVPSYILSVLPDGSGPTDVQNHTMVTFGANGLDIAVADATTDYAVNSVYTGPALTR
jgi:uncharacterized protein (TIGR03437 family)